MRVYTAVTKLIEKLKENGGLSEELQTKVDVLYVMGRIDNEEYLDICDKQGYRINKISDNAFELVEDENYETPTGDYLNPILYADGDSVEIGKWYYNDDKDLPHEAIASGQPVGFTDRNYFDFVE